MQQNPYEPPKEVDSPPTTPSSMAVGLSIGATFLAAWICGGITCYGVGVFGEISAKVFGYEQNADLREIGWMLGIPAALFVMVLIPVISYWLFKKRY
jgi:hypothetical protein